MLRSLIFTVQKEKSGVGKSTHMRDWVLPSAHFICLDDRKDFYLLFSSFAEERFESLPSVFRNESPNDGTFMPQPLSLQMFYYL